jgi:predicted Zn-dependent protease with MMP-like domain
MIEMDRERFEQCVDRAVELIPPRLADMVDNVAILIEDDPPADEPSDLLGLYVGTPLTERFGYGGIGQLPDRIYVFRRPTLAICATPSEVVDEVVITIVHEIAHYFGIEEDRLHELGWQ